MIGGSGFGDVLSDYLDYEARLAAAYASGSNANILAVENSVPASLNPEVAAGSGNPNKMTSCTPDNCPGPYSNPRFNYDAWFQQNQAWGLLTDLPSGSINVPVTLVPPKGKSVQANLQPYQYVSPSQYLNQQITQPPKGGNAVFSFSTSRGNASQIQVGDTWYLNITGSHPNAGVVVVGSTPGGKFSAVQRGITDSNGNFSLSGKPDASMIGNWQEDWYVGSTDPAYKVGSISFSVVAAPTGIIPPQHVSQPPTNTPPVNTTNPTVFDLFGDTSTPITLPFGFQVGEYTALGIAGALVVGLMLLGKRGR